MKNLSVILFAALAFMQVGMSQTGEEHLIARIALTNYPVQMRQIQSMELDVAGVDLTDKTVDVVVGAQMAQRLRDSGFNIIKIISKMSMIAPDQDYQTSAKVEAALKNYAAKYPNLAQIQLAGKSLEGRDIWAIKITSNVGQPNPTKPRIFFNGMHHAREVMSVEVPLDTIETLLTGYGKDPKITHWVDANEIWVLPMFNVDGNGKVWASESMWRKNTRGGYGVDINRNYPYAWNTCNGSSGTQGAQDFRGPSAASEPETQVMMNFVKMIQPVFSISYHSYSEIVIYPYGCEGQHVPTAEVVEGIGKELASKIQKDDNSGHYTAGTAPELLYSVDGGDIDWLYHEANVIPYVIEVNSGRQGFQPSYAKWRNQTVAKAKPGWQFLLDRLDGSSIYGQVKDAQGRGIANATLNIERTSGGAKFTQIYPAHKDGIFRVILPMGQFQVTYSAPGIQSVSQSINVGKTSVNTNVVMK